MRMLCPLLLTLLTLVANHAQAADPKPRVLILGDSISIGYTPFVQEMLADKATVLRPTKGKRPENCAGTNNGIQHIDRWLQIDGGNFDVIHFNFGLHDLKHVDANGQNSNKASDPHQAEPEAYAKQLREMVEKMKATGATLIFATTTPVPEGKLSPLRHPADADRYNEIAVGIMKEHDIRVHDLHKFAQARLDKIQRPANVHFTPEGSKALAEQVVEHVQAALQARQKQPSE
jgi:acyl-CoA thioesterase-1